MKIINRYIRPAMAGLTLLAVGLVGCTAISDENFSPKEPERLYLNDINPINVEAAAGAMATLNVVSNVVWEATVSQNWVTIAIAGAEDPASQSVKGYGNQELILTFDANATADERSVTLTITPEDKVSSVDAVTTTITQITPDFAVAPLIISGLDANSPNKQTITIVADNSWKIMPQDNWIHASEVEGPATEGKQIPVELSFDNNYTSAVREGTVLVTCGDEQSATVRVSQGKASFSVSTDKLEFEQEGETKILSVSCITDWNYTVSGAGWITATHTVVNGGGTITVTAAPNDTCDTRTGILTVISADETSIPVTITQKAGVLSLSGNEFNLTAARKSFNIDVQCPGAWSVSQDSGKDWCTVSSTEKKGNGQLRITVNENTMTDREREAKITVTFGSINESILITQARAIKPTVYVTKIIGDEIGRNQVTVEASVNSVLNITDSGFYYIKGENLDPATALFRTTVKSNVDEEGTMISEIGNLESGSVYVIRAFVETDVYGLIVGDASYFTTKGLWPDNEQHPTPDTK